MISTDLHLIRIDPRRRMARYYQLSLSPSLFGTVVVVFRWGRLGTNGRTKIEHCDHEFAALKILLRMLKSKRSRGYMPIVRETTPEGPTANVGPQKKRAGSHRHTHAGTP